MAPNRRFFAGFLLIALFLATSQADYYPSSGTAPTSSEQHVPRTANYGKPIPKPDYTPPKPTGSYEKPRADSDYNKPMPQAKPDYEKPEQEDNYEKAGPQPKIDYEKLKVESKKLQAKVEYEKPQPEVDYQKPLPKINREEQKVDHYEKSKSSADYEKPKIVYEKPQSEEEKEMPRVQHETPQPKVVYRDQQQKLVDYNKTKPSAGYENPETAYQKPKNDYEQPKVDYRVSSSKVDYVETTSIQGLVYCKTGYKLNPLQGAVVRVTCLTEDEEGYESAPFSFLSSPTDGKGYFFFAKKLSNVQNVGNKICECKAFLNSSPSETCNVPTDVNNGLSGAPLKSFRLLPDNKMKLFTVGPFVYGASNAEPANQGGVY